MPLGVVVVSGFGCGLAAVVFLFFLFGEMISLYPPWVFVPGVFMRGRHCTLMTEHCAICGGEISSVDDRGICHLCKLSIIFNEDTFPEIEDCAS